MANPFLFDGPPAGGAPQDNPFLEGGVGGAGGAGAVNPFLMEGGGGHHGQQQVQYNAFGQPLAPASMPQVMTHHHTSSASQAANPFADFGAPAPPLPPASSAAALFGAPPQHQQHYPQQPQQSHPQEAPSFHDAKIPDTSDRPTPSESTPASAISSEQSAKPVKESAVPPTSEPAPPPPPPPPIEEAEAIAKIEEAKIEDNPFLSQTVEDEPPLPPPPEADVEAVSEGVASSLKMDAEPPPPPSPPPQPEDGEESGSVEPQAIKQTSDKLETSQEDNEGRSHDELANETLGEDQAELQLAVKEDGSGEQVKEKEEVSAKEADMASSPEEKEPTGPSTGASLFGLPGEPEVKEAEEGNDQDAEDSYKPKMSTGDAIFADLPATDVRSTGANIFGTSEESAAGSTGATLFDVAAPRAAQPALGAMTGWDDAFDRKFEDAEATAGASSGVLPGDPFDPFAGSGAGLMPGATAAGFGDASSFSTAPVSAVMAATRKEANPFLEEANNEEDNGDGPLFDDDTSRPLDPFPRVHEKPEGWEFFIRHPPKKKLTAQRYWKKVWVKLVMQGDNPVVQLFENKDAKDAFQELPLQAAYSLSEIAHQVFDQYSKIFTLKLQFIFYKERAGIRPGQISKMQRLTDKIGFLAKAVEDADYQGVKEFASDMKKLGVPLEHAPQITELLKLGSENYEDLKQFSVCVEERLFKMDAHRDRSLTYKTEEVQLTAVDEVYVEQDKLGHVSKQLCRVRVFFLSFLSDMPDVELGVNDIERMGLEVVGRHDILPVPTEQWIRYENIEFHSIVDRKVFEKNDHIIKFQPPDACYLEILRFRVRPPRARELPMQARCKFIISGNRVEIRADMMIPYPHTKAWGQVPCEDVAMRIPLPECWIYQFRTEKHHLSLGEWAAGNINIGTRMGSVKSAHRRAGKVKGLERFMGTLESQTQELMETSSGQAKYEHQHKAIVWRVPRLPKQGQGSYTNHEFVCKMTLTSYDQMPESFEKNFYVEFTQPATAISNTVLRSVSIQPPPEEPPEKFVKYLARHEYKLEIDFCEQEANTYVAVTKKVSEPQPEEPKEKEYPDFPDENGDRKFSDSDSD